MAERPTPLGPGMLAVEGLPAGQRARRERIVDAALELLADDDYDRIQIRSVAERANVALGTLYRYFSSKEQVFAAALVRWGGAYEDRMVAVDTAGVGTPPARLKAALRAAVAAFERQPQFFTLISLLETSDDPAVQELYWRFSQGTRAVFARTLEDVEPEAAASIEQLAMAMLSTLLRAWRNGHLQIGEVREQLDRAVDVLFGKPRVRTHRARAS